MPHLKPTAWRPPAAPAAPAASAASVATSSSKNVMEPLGLTQSDYNQRTVLERLRSNRNSERLVRTSALRLVPVHQAQSLSTERTVSGAA